MSRNSNFLTDVGGAISNVANVGATVLTRPDKVIRGAAKAVEFAVEHPGTVADIGKAIIKEELKPQNLAINAALIGATVLSGGTAAPAALAAKTATAARATKAVTTTVRATKAVETAVEAGKVARTAERALEVGRAAKKGFEGVEEVGKVASTIDKVNDARRWASPVQEAAHGLRTRWGEKILAGAAEGTEASMARQMAANMVQGTGRIGKTTRMAGQSERAYQAQQTARRIKNVRTGVNAAQAAPEVASAVAHPGQYAMKKALGSGGGGEPTGEMYETMPGGQAVVASRKAGMRQGALEGIRTDLNTPNAPGATLPSLSQPGQPPGGPPNTPPPTTSPGPANPPTPQRPAAVIPSRATPGVTGNIGISANGVPTPGRQATFQNTQTNERGGNQRKGGAATRMHAWQGANREGLGGIDVDYDWRRFHKRPMQPWGKFPRQGRAAGGEEGGEAGEGEDEDWRTTPPTTTPPTAAPPSAGATASIMYRPQAAPAVAQATTTPGARYLPKPGAGVPGSPLGRNRSFSSGQVYGEQADDTIGGTLAWNAKGQGSFAFPDLVQPPAQQPKQATDVGTVKPVNPVNGIGNTPRVGDPNAVAPAAPLILPKRKKAA